MTHDRKKFLHEIISYWLEEVNSLFNEHNVKRKLLRMKFSKVTTKQKHILHLIHLLYGNHQYYPKEDQNIVLSIDCYSRRL